MDETLIRLYSGNHTFMRQEWQADGSVIVTISDHRDGYIGSVHVSDLYGPKESVVAVLDVSNAVPDHIVARQAEAQAQWQGILEAKAQAAITPVATGSISPSQGDSPSGDIGSAATPGMTSATPPSVPAPVTS